MGSTGPGLLKARREWQNYCGIQTESVWDQPVAALFTTARADKIGATKIRHKCGYCATIFQSDKIRRGPTKAQPRASSTRPIY
jgi:hypothetical protein